MWIIQKRTFLLMLAAAGCLCAVAPAAHAQQESSSAAAGQSAGTTAANGQQNAPGPVGGVEGYRLEGAGLGHSFYTPRLSLQELYDSNPSYAGTPGASQSDVITSIGGGLSLQWMKRDSTLSLDYNANGLIYNSQTQPNSVVQQLGVTEKLTLRRWDLVFGENFSYLPSSAFGLGGLGLLGGSTSGLPGGGGVTNFNAYQQPSQNIGTTNVNQLSSYSVVQAQYVINGRSSVNGSASVGFLHYFGNNLLNSRDVVAKFGYDRSLTARDTINFSYSVSFLDYPSGTPGFYTQSILFGYRRIVTGRLHLSLSAGPEITHFSPMTGQTTVPGGQNLVGVSANATLEYRLRNGNLSTTYSHGTSGGSGFFVGSLTDQVNGSFSQRFLRVWTADFSGGFAHNSSFEQTTPTTTLGNTASFNYWYAGFAVGRPVGHYSSLRLSYNASRQTGNTTTCVNGTACGPIALVQVIGVTFNWSTRPHKLD